MRETLLRKLASVCAVHYRWVFSIALLLVASVVVFFIVKPPRIDSDILDLLPRHNPTVENFREATHDFKSLDYLFILVQTKDSKGHPIDNYEEFADDMAAGLRKSGMVEGVEYRLQDYEGVIQEMLPYTLLYLNQSDLPEVASRFTDAQIRKQVADNRRFLSNPASLMTKELIQYDPFGLFSVLKRHFMGKTRQLNVDLSDGYYLSKDGSALLMIVRPDHPAQDIAYGKRLMSTVRSLEAKVRAQWGEENPEEVKFLKVSYGGGYPIAQDDANLIKHDALVNTVTSVVLVMFVFLWAFRRKSALVYGWAPLLLGLILTFGIAHLLGVTLNSATAGFGALLVGLGIDFSTVMYGRYIEERNRGLTAEESLASIMGNTGKGVMVGAATTACTFGAMILTQFNGMRQVGIYTAVGILFCCASVFVLLPAMLNFHQIHKTRKGIEPTFHMHSFGFEGMARWAHRHPRWTLSVAAIVTVAMGVLALGVRLDDNVQNLRSPKNMGITVSTEVAKKFGASLTYMMVVVDAPTPDGVVRASKKVIEAVQPFVKAGDILFTDSISTYLPTEKSQEAVLRVLHEDKGEAFSYDRIRAVFDSACQANNFNQAYFDPYLKTLHRMLDPTGPVTYAHLMKGPLAPILRKYIVQKGPDHYRGVAYLYIPDEFKRFEPQGLIRAVHATDPEAKVVGINVLSKVLRRQVRHDALLAFLVGTLLVFLIIVFDFRAFWPAVYSLVPLAVGLVWMLGSLRLMGESLNMMNIFVTTMILGIGSDYGIYLVHRYLEEDGHNMVRVIQETGNPIAIAALTTIAGFGSMSLSSYPGLRSMGYVSLLGSLFCMIGTLTVLVALLTVVDRRKRDRQEGERR
ncbi:MAG: MMPL family transporter [Acidobacteriota bacterium]